MKLSRNIIALFLASALVACAGDGLTSIDEFKTGVFEIPEKEGVSKTIVIRKDSLQIEKFQDRIDTLFINWKNDYSYELQLKNPKTKKDSLPIKVRIKKITKSYYLFEASLGYSNYKVEGKLTKN